MLLISTLVSGKKRGMSPRRVVCFSDLLSIRQPHCYAKCIDLASPFLENSAVCPIRSGYLFNEGRKVICLSNGEIWCVEFNRKTLSFVAESL